ncbi:carbohydrate ABC transporter permease [Bradyrhizobium sp. U87765 SZCCT0131]|uniref:carbohydrate ABC transporter permease n=1 Tax=unclassified Bradyrhizobium TaxID=2631580 RepID=UPI001BA9C0E5|nr:MULTISPECIES: carbohydrate ABC transporter permease [unclassified Bradyrhizobium]MBR1221342.1 carbohydrate ABC transporter permease [Bradyrhizobium sp. U87765 SZCCT0131]MBR1264735.1 carbohydrate ABC transporter permease [Bradyrhizobium sp. U87765 SZCCT0134]MBR1304359.1 carbohydrate ABC transporter permease [Bradyrhizobium sp. U87765 SZCCT0110]MBR1322784.1 carbohydrate ABC transporter permease [Bradyrhizobium sp. U87765 SZCCT0109]MBR1346288.1 carbohydrate ABC transporter permease [Bradyrhizo
MTMLSSSPAPTAARPLVRHLPALRRTLGLVLLAALAFAFIIPILWMVVMSFQSGDKMFQLRTEWIPSVWHPENYPNAWSRAPFGQYFFNSGVVSLAVMVGNVVFCTLAGYGLAKFHFRGAGLVLLLILSTLMLPLEVTLVPTFLVVHKFEWVNTYQGIVAPLLIDAFGVFLMRQSIISIPTDYIEAARIDGAGEIRILLQIIVPQCLPALAVLAIFSFRDSWDQYLWPLTVVSLDNLRTFPLGLVQFGEDYGNPPTEQMVIAVLATLPVFLLFAVLQRAINRGFGLSGLK